MDPEKMIIETMKNLKCSRLEAIAKLDFGTRSEAAKRCLVKRAKVIKLVNSGMSFDIGLFNSQGRK